MGKLQHFVPRFYLRAWADKERVFCLQGNEIRHPNIKGVGAENYFYRLQELSTEDVEFLRKGIINDSPEGLKASHERLVQAFTVPYLAKQKLETRGLATSEAMAGINRTIIELNEKLHTNIEQDFQPYLTAMISGDLSFLKDARKASTFYNGLAVQYARTNHIKNTRLIMERERFELYLRIANPLIHILATNVGSSLYADRKRHAIMLLNNATGIPFITADQPVINIASGPKDTAPPAKFELYYPLSPTKAMLLLEPSSDFLPGDSTVSETFVHLYNLRMAAHSYRQVFSSSPGVLESVRSELAAYLSCFPAATADNEDQGLGIVSR
jgi:Protein of unknown function (DUF4238)